jgi:hypothetical protein
MGDRPDLLVGTQLELWNRIHDAEVRANPDSKVTDVTFAAWHRFQSLCWMFDDRLKSPDIQQCDYENFDAGPDLTVLGRARFASPQKPPKKPKPPKEQKPPKEPKTPWSHPKSLSGYNIYVKTSLQEHKVDWAQLSQAERVQRIAGAWNAMSKEEKANYAPK